MIPPRRIALSGGGMKGIAHVGALEVLQEKGLLGSVREYLGTSAGALIALCMVIGYTLSELRSLCSVLDFTQAQNLNFDTMLQFPEALGLDDGKNVERFLGVLIRAKGLPDTITFEEFYQRFPKRPRLRIFATNLDTLSVHEFSIKTPRVQLTFATRASMTIPFLFTPVRDPSGHLLVDGALISHFPFHHISDSEREETLGLAFNILENGTPIESYTLMPFFVHCILSTYKHHDREMFSKWHHRIIDIVCNEYESMNFNASQGKKIEIMNSGRKAALEYFSRAYRKPLRRYSLP